MRLVPHEDPVLLIVRDGAPHVKRLTGSVAVISPSSYVGSENFIKSRWSDRCEIDPNDDT